MPNRKPTGYVLWEGNSLLDGRPIVVIATTKSRNRKTANMVQTFILCRDIDPITANRTGADKAICGDCPHRGHASPNKATGLAVGRSCYVNLGQAPTVVHRTYQAGRYPKATRAQLAEIGHGRMVRIGTYGDGAAVPAWVWNNLTRDASGHTAYSHQSGAKRSSFDASRFMVSAETLAGARAAWEMGARTFRIVRDVAEVVKGSEILCPASKEAGERTTCNTCGLCAGSSVRAKSIAIVAHGAGAVHFNA